DAGGAGLLHHGHRVGGLPDVAIAEHGDVDVLDQTGDVVPGRVTGVGLGHRTRVQRDRGAAGVLGDAPGIQVGVVVSVDAHAGLHRHRDAVAVGGLDHRGQDRLEPVTLPRQ